MTANMIDIEVVAESPAAAAARKPRKPAAAKPAAAPKAPKEAKPAAEAKPAKVAKAPTLGKAAEIDAQARSGILPPAPDFTAPTHKGHLKKHAALVALADAGDLAALQAFAIKPTSSSPKALIRYRDRCILALKARAEAA